jgi:hypothetical protein
MLTGEIFLFSGDIFLRSNETISVSYAPGTPISSTILNGSVLVSRKGDLVAPVTTGTVESLSPFQLHLRMGPAVIESILRILFISFSSSGLQLLVGPNHTAISLTDYGLTPSVH